MSRHAEMLVAFVLTEIMSSLNYISRQAVMHVAFVKRKVWNTSADRQ